MNSKRPVVSVVIPSLNRAHFLAPTLESVLRQHYRPIECIVVDGGSTDSTLEILRRYEGRIKWVSEPDNGHADAINKGWRMSKGEILAWLNADDVWDVPAAVGQAVAYLQSHPEVDVVYGDCGAIDAHGRPKGMSYLHEWDLEYEVEHCDHCIPQPASFIRRRILKQVGYLDTTFFYVGQDHELWLRIGLEGTIRHLPMLLAHARSTKGLSNDGKKTAPACVQVTRKFYSLPNIPHTLRRKKRRAFSNSYLRGMDYAFSFGRHWKIICTYALRAALVDPTNWLRAFSNLEWYIATGARQSKSPWMVRVGRKFLPASSRVLREIKSWWK